MTLAALVVAAPVLPERCDPEVLDSYCQLYTQVVRNRGDGEKIKAPLEIKKAILKNEKLFNRVCPQQDNKA